MTDATAPAPRPLYARLLDARPGEGPSIAWATAYFFLLLCANFTLRPVREALGIARGADDLPLVWTGTLTLSLLVQPLFATLIAKMPRRKFVPIVYHVAVAFLLSFRAAFHFAPQSWQVGLGYAFYIWFSVFNVFAMSVFWGFAADLFRLEQAKRLFGFISVGGTVGAMAGSALAKTLTGRIGSLNLLFLGCVLLEIAVLCVHALARRHPQDTHRDTVPAEARPTSVWRGLEYIRQSRYLQGICLFTLFHTLFGTVLYFEQANLVSAVLPDRNARTEYFASVDFFGSLLTLVIQVFATGVLIRKLGVGFALVTQPVVAGLACLGLGLVIWRGADFFGESWAFAWPPALVAVATARVLVSASNYATAKPARESLYTVVARDAKYASKSFVDTFVYRGGDLIGAWTFKLFDAVLHVSLAAIAIGAAPLALVWLGVGLILGREQRALGGERTARAPDPGSINPPG